MSDDFIAQMIKHSETSDSPLLKLLIEQLTNKKKRGESEAKEIRDHSPQSYIHLGALVQTESESPRSNESR